MAIKHLPHNKVNKFRLLSRWVIKFYKVVEHNLLTPWGANINKFLFQITRGSTLDHIICSEAISFSVAVNSPGKGGQGYILITVFLDALFSCYSFQVTWLSKVNNDISSQLNLLCYWELGKIMWLCHCFGFLLKIFKILVLAWSTYKSKSHDLALLVKDN